ncbi:hypothetical protein [Nocardia wallacei]|uniref:hypothetical protein n=1 Tax=Nocardia wallacei TaxID=480035 RepID=UPI0024542668|nr:hypothetical protein [Nocardia wallacei]
MAIEESKRAQPNPTTATDARGTPPQAEGPQAMEAPMRTPDNSDDDINDDPDNTGENKDAVVIPLRRKASRNNSDDGKEIPPKTGFDLLVWRYDKSKKRAADQRYAGHVHYVHGARAEQLRGELADVTAQLLVWAVQQQSDDRSRQDGAAA